jgi:hypothetical protein
MSVIIHMLEQEAWDCAESMVYGSAGFDIVKGHR